MSKRESTIRVRQKHRQEIERITRRKYGTPMVPFGIVIQDLIDETDHE
jgi:hypothetical protein